MRKTRIFPSILGIYLLKSKTKSNAVKIVTEPEIWQRKTSKNKFQGCIHMLFETIIIGAVEERVLY